MNPYMKKACKPVKMAKGGEVKTPYGKTKGTESKRYGHPILDAAVKLMKGSGATKSAQKGYAKRRKHLVDKEVAKAE